MLVFRESETFASKDKINVSHDMGGMEDFIKTADEFVGQLGIGQVAHDEV